MTIKFVRSTEPYTYGWVATLGDRRVEVLRIEQGTWGVFAWRGGLPVTYDAIDAVGGKSTTYAKAIMAARRVLVMEPPPPVWRNGVVTP